MQQQPKLETVFLPSVIAICGPFPWAFSDDSELWLDWWLAVLETTQSHNFYKLQSRNIDKKTLQDCQAEHDAAYAAVLDKVANLLLSSRHKCFDGLVTASDRLARWQSDPGVQNMCALQLGIDSDTILGQNSLSVRPSVYGSSFERDMKRLDEARTALRREKQRLAMELNEAETLRGRGEAFWVDLVRSRTPKCTGPWSKLSVSQQRLVVLRGLTAPPASMDDIDALRDIRARGLSFIGGRLVAAQKRATTAAGGGGQRRDAVMATLLLLGVLLYATNPDWEDRAVSFVRTHMSCDPGVAKRTLKSMLKAL